MFKVSKFVFATFISLTTPILVMGQNFAESPLEKRILASRTADTELWSTWVELRRMPTDTTSYEVNVWVDSSQYSQRLNKLIGVLDQHIGAGNYQLINSIELPVSQLLCRLNLLIESSNTLDGCVLNAAKFEGRFFGGELVGIDLIFYGRILREWQRTKLDYLSNTILFGKSSRPEWRRLSFSPHFQDIAALPLTTSSNARAARNYQLGRTNLDCGNYPMANYYFQNAVLDRPSSTTYRYWRIISLLESCQDGDAVAHMTALLRRSPRSNRDPNMLESLMSTQGQIRKRLLATEALAFRQLAKAKN